MPVAYGDLLAGLVEPNAAWAAANPGPGVARQPVHVVYGGAHLFSADTPRKLGTLALRALDEHAPDVERFAAVLGLPDAHAADVYARVRTKLGTEPVEDYRIDFEDGYGTRGDAEEDAHAAAVAGALAAGAKAGTLPPFVGIRVKALSEEAKRRSVRTLVRFLEAFAATGTPLPSRFVVTLPKVVIPEQVATLAQLLTRAEADLGLPRIGIELMIEHVSAILGPDGPMPARLVAAADGRCVGAHFGTYDYTASAGITAAHQRPDHAACDLARGLLQIALANSGVALSDGATTVMPVGGTASVHDAWRVHYANVRRSLAHGFYQGWDLHPAQLPVRFAATYTFFREVLAPTTARLAGFLDRAAQATRLGVEFDDAATGQGLLNTLLRGVACGAYTEAEVLAAGLGAADLRERSFARIVDRRRG